MMEKGRIRRNKLNKKKNHFLKNQMMISLMTVQYRSHKNRRTTRKRKKRNRKVRRNRRERRKVKKVISPRSKRKTHNMMIRAKKNDNVINQYIIITSIIR
jgi:hypothetical protein